MLTENSFDTGTLTINYAEGSDNGHPFVFLHGATARWQELTPLYTELERHWHVYACDMRGHGKSGRADAYRAVDFFPIQLNSLEIIFAPLSFCWDIPVGQSPHWALPPKFPS